MTFRASRQIPAPPTSIIAAFADSEGLARWWGPGGFTSTFTTFTFEPGGRWSFVMVGPDGRRYPNEIVVKEIDSPRRIMLDHVSPPGYALEVTLEPTDGGGTLVGWAQTFEKPEVGERMESILRQANQELLDRLAAEVLGAQERPAEIETR